jgi:hypothetical protein
MQLRHNTELFLKNRRLLMEDVTITLFGFGHAVSKLDINKGQEITQKCVSIEILGKRAGNTIMAVDEASGSTLRLADVVIFWEAGQEDSHETQSLLNENHDNYRYVKSTVAGFSGSGCCGFARINDGAIVLRAEEISYEIIGRCLLRYRECGGGWGCIDENGMIAIPPEYNEIDDDGNDESCPQNVFLYKIENGREVYAEWSAEGGLTFENQEARKENFLVHKYGGIIYELIEWSCFRCQKKTVDMVYEYLQDGTFICSFYIPGFVHFGSYVLPNLGAAKCLLEIFRKKSLVYPPEYIASPLYTISERANYEER